MANKKAKQKSENGTSQVNNFLILVIIILTFVMVFSAIRRNQNSVVAVNAVEQVEDASSAPVEKIVIGDSEVDIDQQIEDFIMNNPEVILDSVNNYQNQQARDRDTGKAQKLAAIYDDLISDLPFAGPADAEHEIIEFYDYNCGYCKQVVPVVNKVIAERSDTKVYYVDYPILGASSEELAKVSVAAYLIEPDRFLEIHNHIIKLGRVSASKAVSSLVAIGFDQDELADKVNSSEVANFLQKNRSLGSKISVTGTPTFIVNKEFFGGALSYEAVSNVLDK